MRAPSPHISCTRAPRHPCTLKLGTQIREACREDARRPWEGGGAGRGRRGRCGRGRGPRARGVPHPPLRPPLSPAAPPRFAMVERGDAAPLLRWAEGPAVSPPQAPELQAGGRGWGGGGRGAAEPPRRREPEELGASEVLLQPGRLELGDVEEDQVVAVFVVTFDPRSGESLSETRGGRGSPPNRAWGAAGEGLAARAPAPTHLHPHPAAGSGGGSRTSPAGCPPELGRGTRGFVPGALRPPLLPVRLLPGSSQPARPSSLSCLCCSDRGSCLWLLFSCLAKRVFFPHLRARPPPRVTPETSVLCFPPSLPTWPCRLLCKRPTLLSLTLFCGINAGGIKG